MMCRKCGVSIPAGADTCPNCGAPAPNRRERRPVSRAANPKMAAKIPFMLMALAALHIAEIVTWFLGAVNMDVEGALAGTKSLFSILNVMSGRTFVFNLVTVAFCALAALAVVFAVLPVFRGGNGRRMRMPVSKAAVLLHAATLGVLYGGFYAANSDAGLATTLTAGGILQLILCAAIFALTMTVSFASKQRKVERI